jgi:hypothetical protein
MVLVENVLTKQQVNNIGASTIKSINEAIQVELSAHKGKIEGEMAAKFDKLVESIAVKFSNQVDKAIVESVSNKINGDVNSKLVEVVTGMINVLESAGVYNTEKTKELYSLLKEANSKVETAYKEREVLLDQFNAEKKKNYIHSRLSGMKPEIVNSALAYFADKDILDVQDEIDAFIDGDFSELISDNSDTFDDGLTDVTLDQVDDMLSDINSEKTQSRKKIQLESLGKGLNPVRGDGVNRNSSLSLDAMIEAEENNEYDPDMNIALNQIANFRDLGYKFM